jgi:hypothetical protein
VKSKNSGKNNPMFGRKHTEKSKKLMSQKIKMWYDNNPEFKSKLSINKSKLMKAYFKKYPEKWNNFSNNGKKFSEEHKKKLSLAWTDAMKRKQGILMKNRRTGVKISKESKRKMSISKSGKNNYYWGKHLSAEHRKKISETHKGMTYGEETRKKISKLAKVRMKNFVKNNRKWVTNHPKLVYCPELGHGIRSSWEKEVGLILKNAGISYNYEKVRFDLGDCVYIPDFDITPKIYVEVKGYLRNDNIEKLKKFQKLYPDIKLIGIGKGNNKIFDIYLKWEERNKIVNILKNN